MALIKLGSVVTRISGKVGGQQFGTTAAGSYMKNSGTPRKSITLLQQTKMQKMSDTSQQWRKLTDPERQLYINASPSYPYLNRVGETKFYSGYAIFAMLRNNQVNAQISPTHAPLPKFSFTAATSATISQIGTVVTWRFSPIQTGVEYRLFMSRPTSQGVTRGYKNHFFIRRETGSGLATGVQIQADMIAKFGGVIAQTKVFWRIDAIHLNSGQSLKGMATGSMVLT